MGETNLQPQDKAVHKRLLKSVLSNAPKSSGKRAVREGNDFNLFASGDDEFKKVFIKNIVKCFLMQFDLVNKKILFEKALLFRLISKNKSQRDLRLWKRAE